MMDKNVPQLGEKKLAILLFLIDFNHFEEFGTKVFGETYIKANRNPQPKVLTNMFDIIAYDKDIDEDDEQFYFIQELLDHLNIKIIKKKNYVELNFKKIEEDFDKSLFSSDELKTLNSVVEKYKKFTPRKIANVCFSIDRVRETDNGEVVI
jgi:hypothetical protein